jgi:hypothetical protein
MEHMIGDDNLGQESSFIGHSGIAINAEDWVLNRLKRPL